MLTEDDLAGLMTAGTTPAVSIFLPTHIAGREVRQNPIRLKVLLREAKRQLAETGLRETDADQLLASVGELVEDYAAVHTLLQGGQVHVMDRGDLPHGEFAAAIFRY